MNNKNISPYVIGRLPRYYRYLGDLYDAGITKISSSQLAKRMGLTASLIRQDLNYFGGFGQQGYGYNTLMLQQEIGDILGINSPKSAILIGVGNLGHAVATHLNFESQGFQLTGLFDKNEALIGTVVRNIPVRNITMLDEFCKENKPDTAILCIPKETVPPIADHLIRLGIRGFLNFSHYDLSLKHDGITVENVHLSDSLMRLSYNLKNMDK